MIKLKSLSSEISKRFNHFEYLENHNETFIKCKSESNQTLEKVCGWDEFKSIKKNENITCEEKNTNRQVLLTKGDICRDLQFLKNMSYPKKNISYVENRLYDGKKKICNKCDQYQKFSFSSFSLSFIYSWCISQFLGSQNRLSLKFSNRSVIKKVALYIN